MSSCNNKEWKETTLGEMLTFQRGFDITKKEQQSGPYQVISSSGPKSTHCDFKVKGPGVIIGRKGTLGNVFYSERPFWPHDTTLWVKDFHGNYEKFAYYFLQTMKLEQYDCGASNPTINRNHIHSLTIRFPQLTTQKKIASILSNYDDLIENNTRRIEILEQMAKLVYEEWFVKFRFPGHEKVKMVPSELGEIPEGWEVKTLEDVCSKISSGGTPARKNSDFWEKGNILWFKTKELTDGYLFQSEEMITDVGLKNSSAKLFPKETVVMAIYAAPTVGRLGILTKPSTFNQAACGLIPNQEILTTSFLFFKLFEMRDYFNSLAQGAAQQNINVHKVCEAKLVVPSVKVVKTFDNYVRKIMDEIKILSAKNQNLRKTRDLLLPKLISGEIDVSDLDIRIRNEYQEHNINFGEPQDEEGLRSKMD